MVMEMPEQIPEEFIEEIKSETDVVEIISEFVQLKRRGRNYLGLCPFHSEKTPSFTVSPDKQIFRCFGCGKGGNVITFLMELEGISFFDAISRLAENTGKPVPNQISANQNSSLSHEDQNMLEAHEWLMKLYHHLLKHTKEGKDGLEYLKNRGISDETIDQFQLGFAPDIENFTASFLEKKGFSLQSMIKAGLLADHRENKYIDRFHGRVIFPIRNHQGKTVAFGGRMIYQGEPKYLNSPETGIFHKGNIFYNFDLARQAIRKSGEAVLFEGYMDVISASQAGIDNGIASLGTSLTESQARLLRRYADRVVICYDADSAGIEATRKAANILQNAGCYVKIAQLKQGMDPDDYIKKYGGDSFRDHVIGASITYMTFYLDYLKRDYNLQIESESMQYIERALDEIAKLRKPFEIDHYLNELGDRFDISKDALQQEIAYRRRKFDKYKDNQQTKSHTNNRKNSYKENKLLPAFQNAERHLISLMLNNRNIAEKVQQELGGTFLITEHQVLVTYLYAFYEEGHEPDVSLFMEYLPESNLKDLAAQLAMQTVPDEVTDMEIEDYIYTIKSERHKKNTIHSLELEQKEAERRNDPVTAAKIAMNILNLKKEWKKAKHR